VTNVEKKTKKMIFVAKLSRGCRRKASVGSGIRKRSPQHSGIDRWVASLDCRWGVFARSLPGAVAIA
jgi:hypothetical protein